MNDVAGEGERDYVVFLCRDGTAAGDGAWFGFESYGYVRFAYYLALSVSGNNLYWGREVYGIIE